jgi:hypothetical protein
MTPIMDSGDFWSQFEDRLRTDQAAYHLWFRFFVIWALWLTSVLVPPLRTMMSDLSDDWSLVVFGASLICWWVGYTLNQARRSLIKNLIGFHLLVVFGSAVAATSFGLYDSASLDVLLDTLIGALAATTLGGLFVRSRKFQEFLYWITASVIVAACLFALRYDHFGDYVAAVLLSVFVFSDAAGGWRASRTKWDPSPVSDLICGAGKMNLSILCFDLRLLSSVIFGTRS